MNSYIALIHKERKSDFGVSFPDLPGLVTGGKTLDEARARATEALALHLEGLVEEKAAIPEPSSLDVIMASSENRHRVVIVVDAPSEIMRVIRVNVTLPDGLLSAIDSFAQHHSQSRSAVLAEAARAMLEGFRPQETPASKASAGKGKGKKATRQKEKV